VDETQPVDEAAAQELAKELHKAMKGMGKNASDVVQVLCTQSRAQTAAIKVSADDHHT
jgi:type IV pilus biogenesis protein CpaD/CtpE